MNPYKYRFKILTKVKHIRYDESSTHRFKKSPRLNNGGFSFVTDFRLSSNVGLWLSLFRLGWYVDLTLLVVGPQQV